MKEERKSIIRRLYNAARMATAEAWRNDADKVKEVRDIACTHMYGEHYSDLSDNEIARVIDHLNVLNGSLDDSMSPRICASGKQLRTLRFYAMACAIHYCEFKDGFRYYDEKSQTTLSGEQLRKWVRREFEDCEGYLPKAIFSHLYTWINPKTHKLLEEGGHRKWRADTQLFYYNYLMPQEAQYLINRYRAIAETTGMREDPRPETNHISLN